MRQLARPHRAPSGEQQLRRIHQLDQLRQPPQIHRPLDAEQHLRRQRELGEQHLRQRVGAAKVHLQPDGHAVMPVVQPLAQRGPQVRHILLVHREIGVPRNTELRKFLHLAARKQVFQMGTHDAGQTDEQALAFRDLGRHGHQARQRTRYAQNGHIVVATKSIIALQPHDEVQRLVGHLGKRMGRIQPNRHQQRLHLLGEIAVHPFPLGRRAVAIGHHTDADTPEGRADLFVVDPVLLRHQGMGMVGQGLQRCRHGRPLLDGRTHGRDLRCGAHLEELVQIGGDDGQEPQPLQQRHIVAHGPGQHAFVERQNAQVPIQQRQHWRRRHGQQGRHFHWRTGGGRRAQLQRCHHVCTPTHGDIADNSFFCHRVVIEGGGSGMHTRNPSGEASSIGGQCDKPMTTA